VQIRGYEIDDGWLHPARIVKSPNFDARPPGTRIDLLVIHSISLPPGQFGGPWIDDLFSNRLDPQVHPFFETIHQAKVSAHLLIRRDGEVVQYVAFSARAWHAGASNFQGRETCNNFSIGIELEGFDDQAFEDVQYQRLVDISHAIMHAYPGITPDRITGHEHIAPGRKTDPGPFFDWARYRRLLDSRQA